MLQITRLGVRAPSDDEVAAWRTEFARRHACAVPGLVSPDLLAWTRGRLAEAPFTEFVHDTLDPPAVDLFMSDVSLHLTLWTVFNDTRLFDAVQRVTGCDPIGSYHCRVLAVDPAVAHTDTWHSDVDGNRMVAMSVNLGDPYEGGALRIREDSLIVHEVGSPLPGDAILFRIRPGLEHAAAPVTGTRRRTALVGWFQRAPQALEVLRRRAADGKRYMAGPFPFSTLPSP